MRRRLAVALMIAGGLLLAGVAGLLIYVSTANLAAFARDHAERLAGRPVRISSLHVGLGRLVHVSIRNLRLPSAADASLPDFVTVPEAEADVELWPLFRGALVVQSLSIDGLAVTLQRNADGIGTWARSGAAPKPADTPPGPPATMPALLDVALRNADIVSVGSSGKPFRIHLDRAAIRTPSPADPVSLEAAGSLQAVPVALQAVLDSYQALQARPKPFNMDLHLTSNRSTLSFKGTATDPLGFDGADGAMALDVPLLTELLRSAGVDTRADLPVTLAGRLTRAGSDWNLNQARGKLDEAAFTGDIQYIEGARGQPDSIAPKLAFAALDVGRLEAKIGSPGPSRDSGTTLPVVSLEPDPRINAELSAQQVVSGALRLGGATVHVLVEPGAIVVDETRFGFGGGRASVALEARPAAGGTRLSGSATADAVNLRQALLAAGSKPLPANGPLSGRMLMDITGRTLEEALSHGRVTLALSMAGGTIKANLVRQVALDIRSLFGEESGTTRLECLLAVADLRNGAGTIGPVRLVTPEGAVDGWGEADAARSTIDMTLQSDRATTGTLALDVPIRITGKLSSPSIAPSLEATRRRFGPSRLGPWPAEITRFMQTSPCLRTR